MTPSIHAGRHASIETLLKIVRTAAPHAIIVSKARIAAVQAPAVAPSLDSLSLRSLALSLTGEDILLHTLLCIVQAAVKVSSALGVTITHPFLNLLWVG